MDRMDAQEYTSPEKASIVKDLQNAREKSKSGIDAIDNFDPTERQKKCINFLWVTSISTVAFMVFMCFY